MSLHELVGVLGRGKVEKRTGWINSGVPQPESITDHMHRVALLALLLPQGGSRDWVIGVAVQFFNRNLVMDSRRSYI